MEIDFFKEGCKSSSNKQLFGLCDKGNQTPAYIDENNNEDWIATVENKEQKEVDFIAVDNCIPIWRDVDSKVMDNRCDGMLCYDMRKLVFVELKDRKLKNASSFVKEAVLQLKTTILHFKKEYKSSHNYNITAAFIANKREIHTSYMARMEQFETETGCILQIKNKIVIT